MKKGLTIDFVMDNVPSKEALYLADALLFAVYGWMPDKVRKMKLSSVTRWVGFAKNRMTLGDAQKLRTILKPKKVSIWNKIFKINI